MKALSTSFLTLLVMSPLASFGGELAQGRLTLRPIGTTTAPQGFMEYLPAGYGDGSRKPLIIFLSGKGQSGAGDAAALEHLGDFALGEELKKGRWPKERPFVILTPQHVDLKTCPSADEVDAFIQYAKANYHVDTDRIYLTGASCGAHGVGNYLAKYGGRDVAAAVPLSGNVWPAWEKQGCRVVQDVALFGAHGGRDITVKIEPSAAAFLNFSSCPHRRDVEWVVYPEAGHTDPISWLYSREADYDVFAWMLQHKKAPPRQQITDASPIGVDPAAAR